MNFNLISCYFSAFHTIKILLKVLISRNSLKSVFHCYAFTLKSYINSAYCVQNFINMYAARWVCPDSSKCAHNLFPSSACTLDICAYDVMCFMYNKLNGKIHTTETLRQIKILSLPSLCLFLFLFLFHKHNQTHPSIKFLHLNSLSISYW